MDNTIYVVEPGDTLSGISKKFGVDMNIIARYNGIADPNFIEAGRILRIPPNNNENVYIVMKGDTLSGIAKMFGTTVDELTALNDIANPNVISVGQVITLPHNSDDEVYVVRKGDTLFYIAKLHNTTIDALADFNGIENPNHIEVGQVLRIPPDDYMSTITEYTVRSGDSLWKIARRFGTTVANLINLNRITQPDLIYPGQVITLR